MRLLIVGPQGAGKGTQALLLKDKLAIPHVSTGDLFRANVGAGTELGLKVKAIMDSGALVPDTITQDMLVNRIAEPDAGHGFLLDGFPRTIPQAQWLDKTLADQGHAIDVVVLLDAPDAVLRERMMSRGRADDTPEAIDNRLALYHQETAPLVGHYGARVITVDGVGEVEQVHQRIIDGLPADPDRPESTDPAPASGTAATTSPAATDSGDV